MGQHDFKRYPELTNSQMQFYYMDSPHKQITEDFIATVVKVHDGDTVTLSCDFRDFNFPVRFSDTNAPELNEDGGHEARDKLASIIDGEEVQILINPINRVGKWGRLLGTIMFRGLSMNELMKQQGFSTTFELRKQGTIPTLVMDGGL